MWKISAEYVGKIKLTTHLEGFSADLSAIVTVYEDQDLIMLLDRRMPF